MNGKFNDLYEKYGMILNLKYMNNIIENSTVFEEFLEEFKRVKEEGKKEGIEIEKLRDFFEKYSRFINSEAYIFYVLKTISETSNGEISQHRQSFPIIVQRCKKALKNSDFAHYEIDKKATKIGDEIKRVTAQFLVTGKDKQNETPNSLRLEALERDIDLNLLFDVDSCNQMKSVYGKSQDLSCYIEKLGFVNALSKVSQLSQKEKLDLVDDSDNKLKGILQENLKEISEKTNNEDFYKYIPVYLRKYPEEFNLDLMLMFAAFRINSKLEHEELSNEDNIKYAKLLKTIQKHIKSHRAKVEIKNGEKTFIYSYSILENACNRITSNDRYFPVAKENDIRDQMCLDGNAIRNIDIDYAKIMKFEMEEYKELIESTDGILLYLVQNGLISKKDYNSILNSANINQNDFIELINERKVTEEQIKKYLGKQEIICENLFSIIDKNDLLSSEEKLDYYLKGKIDIKSFTKMSDKNRLEMAKSLSTDTLIELYKDLDKQEEYERYANIFRMLVLSDKNKEEKDNISDDIIEQLGLNFENEDLVRLYQEHLISIRAVEGWGGNSLIADMMKNAILKPSDVREFSKEGNYDFIFEIMKDANIPRKNKLGIFYTTFADEDDTLTQQQQELRDIAKEECLIYMNFSNKRIKNDKKENKVDNEEKVGGNQVKEKRNEYVSDPLNRWTLIRLLDEEYSYEMLDQGMMIFKLPNLDGGTIILEKMFRKEVPDYARATKVLHMSIEEFEKIKKDLIIQGDIPVFAVDKHPELAGKVESVWHSTSWGQKMADLFDYKMDKIRSKENIEKIDREIERIKSSRRLR